MDGDVIGIDTACTAKSVRTRAGACTCKQPISADTSRCVQLSGYLVTKPILTTNDKHTFCKFRLLVKGDSDKYYFVTAWGRQAINCYKFLQKGSGVTVHGEKKEHIVGNGIYHEFNAELVIFNSNIKAYEGDAI